ncbi:hypothetical protein [Anderseniella sp. Alg231-50]|uniref:hypothetical protein n=1 Tax=Anderseniella sp. Alg231-50 TaxID=1922226 RepID=UPI000D55D3F9
MTARNNNGKEQGGAGDARLAEVLAAYGRNPLRWPEADRVRFANLLREPELLPGDLSAGADQLDKLLDTATAVAIAEPEGARDRLLSAVAAEPDASGTALMHGGKSRWQSGFRPQQLLVAGTLAASVMLGVFVGAGTDVGTILADSLQLPAATDDVLDVVLLDDGDDGSLL